MTNRTVGLALFALLAPACAHHSRTLESADEHAPTTSAAALELLMEGNERFVAGTPQHDHETIARRMKLTEGQAPCAVVLTCADSRVVPELIFDVGLGDVFVIRVAGNVVAEDEAGSIEYAVEHLDVPLVIVLGHESCGAVTAALSAEPDEFDELTRLLERLRPSLQGIDRSRPKADQIHAGVETNAQRSTRQLRQLLSGHNVPGDLQVVPAVYELGSGRVRLLDR